MKKSYIKPEVQVISYALNEAIANNCGTQLFNHAQGSCDLMEPFYGWNQEGYFNLADNSCSKQLMDYCTYTAADAFTS